MERFYKISEPLESKPLRLVASVALAFIVMMFINGFIGSMGGLPAFIAFAVVFYRLRVLAGAGDRVTYRPGTTDRKIVGRMLTFYSVGYLFLWGCLRVALTFSRVKGWGNINGSSAMEYLRELFATSMMEKWAYFFAGILMFAFVLSLFPLVVMKRQGLWVAYALLDGAAFALACEGIGLICRAGAEHSTLGKGNCLIDYLLMSRELVLWQEILCLLGAVLFTLILGILTFCFAVNCYTTQKNLTEEEANWWKSSVKTFREMDAKHRRHAVILMVGSVAAIAVVLIIVLTAPEDSANRYEKVAEFLTEDYELGPMEYHGRIYLPVDEQLELYQTGTPKGYLGEKGEECDSRLYELTVANVLYYDTTGQTSHLQVYGDTIGSFAPAGELEQSMEWMQDSTYLLWDEEWISESSYSHEPTGYTTCDRSFVEALEAKFGEVTYQLEDFDSYDAYFSLYGYEDMEEALTEQSTPGHWIGCILVRDDHFYYGSYQNEITGVLRQQLLDILGGY